MIVDQEDVGLFTYCWGCTMAGTPVRQIDKGMSVMIRAWYNKPGMNIDVYLQFLAILTEVEFPDKYKENMLSNIATYTGREFEEVQRMYEAFSVWGQPFGLDLTTANHLDRHEAVFHGEHSDEALLIYFAIDSQLEEAWIDNSVDPKEARERAHYIKEVQFLSRYHREGKYAPVEECLKYYHDGVSFNDLVLEWNPKSLVAGDIREYRRRKAMREE